QAHGAGVAVGAGAFLRGEEADIKRQRTAVQRLRLVGSPLGLLSPLVTDRLSHLPSGALRPSDLDALLVTERIFGPLGAAIQASVFITLATHPGLRAEADRLSDRAYGWPGRGKVIWRTINSGHEP
ncbi:hypothetical protein ACWDA9_32295, partial [Streptomyces sp. NPDC001193]